MSHFTRIKTQMVERDYLVKALEDLGYRCQVGDVQVGGFFGERTTAEIKVRASIVGGEIGFRKTRDSYEMVADWWRIGLKRDQFLRQLTQRYAYHAARAKLEKQGFSLVSEETQKDGRIHLVLRRMS